MSDKEALQEIIYMVNNYVNFADHVSPFELIDDLVKLLEEKGIGRPSTYAPTTYTLILRNYA